MDAVDRAFQQVHRRGFVPPSLVDLSEVDAPLPIGHNQTISQPTTVRLMLEWLNAQPGDTVLDVGSGSGWTTALLSNIVGSKGKVFALEIIPELVEMGRNNCKNEGVKNVQFFQASKRRGGLSEYAPYDRILVSAAAQELPGELLSQVKVGGRLVVPVKNDILEITKTSIDGYKVDIHPGFVFVPLV